VKIASWKERLVLDTNVNIGISPTNFQQIAWVDDFSQSTSPYLQETFSTTYDPSKKVFWQQKKLTFIVSNGFDFLLASCFSTFPLNGLP